MARAKQILLWSHTLVRRSATPVVHSPALHSASSVWPRLSPKGTAGRAAAGATIRPRPEEAQLHSKWPALKSPLSGLGMPYIEGFG